MSSITFAAASPKNSNWTACGSAGQPNIAELETLAHHQDSLGLPGCRAGEEIE